MASTRRMDTGQNTATHPHPHRRMPPPEAGAVTRMYPAMGEEGLMGWKTLAGSNKAGCGRGRDLLPPGLLSSIQQFL